MALQALQSINILHRKPVERHVIYQTHKNTELKEEEEEERHVVVY
jgi:hypothetical protein